jgi:hypothetical protein
VLPADARERPRVREGENGGEHRQAAHDDEGASGMCGSEEREAQVGRVIGGSEERGVQDGVCGGRQQQRSNLAYADADADLL